MARTPIDYTGKKFGKLTALRYEPVARANREKYGYQGVSAWLCRCECGKELVVLTRHLTGKTVTSCPSCHPHALKLWTTRGRLIVMGERYEREYGRNSNKCVRVKCKCGNPCTFLVRKSEFWKPFADGVCCGRCHVYLRNKRQMVIYRSDFVDYKEFVDRIKDTGWYDTIVDENRDVLWKRV